MNSTNTTQAPAELDCTFAVICTDNSMMNARLFKGDTVFIREQSEVDNGTIAAIMINDGVILRRVYRYDNRTELHPENPTIPALTYKGEDQAEIEILGKAVGFISTNL